MTLWLPEWLVWGFAAYGALCLASALARGVISVIERRAAESSYVVGNTGPELFRPSPTKDEPQPAPRGRPTKS